MQSSLSTLLSIPLGAAIAGGVLLIVLAGLLVALLAQRAHARRIAEAGQRAAKDLKENFDRLIADRDKQIDELDARLEQQRQATTRYQTQSAALEAQMKEQRQQAEENLARYEQARKQMTDEFKVIASDVLKSHGETFSKQNQTQVDTLLKPLREKIGEFHKGLIEDRASLSAQIRQLQEDGMRMATEAHNLTRALKGNAQTQGAWGEMILSTILERSGLREGEQYFTQQSYSGEAESRVRTDVEVLMPNGNRMVIDSKVSLVAFEALTNEEDEDARARHLRDHVTSMRAHVKTLGSKDYHRRADSGVDFVLMFVPIEGAFAAAITAAPELIDYAVEQGVVMTTPTTLLSALRTIRNVWDTEKRNQNAEEIAKRAGALYDKVVGFAGNMETLGASLERAQKNFADAKGQLIEGRGSVVRQVEMLRELGAKTSKQLPQDWQAREGEETARPALPETAETGADDEGLKRP